MEQLQKAIESLSYTVGRYPAEEIEIIRANKDAALPYLREAIDRAVFENDDLDEKYQLHFFALYFLGEFQDRESFERITALVSLPNDTLEYLIGDAITETLNHVLYNTFNGNLVLLKECIINDELGEFVRAAYLDVYVQLYLDGVVSEAELKAFIRQNIYKEDWTDSVIYDDYVDVICRCHFVDMLLDMRYMAEHDMFDSRVNGEYDSCVDFLFDYNEIYARFCESPMSIDRLQYWASFQTKEQLQERHKALDKRLKQLDREELLTLQALKTSKIGRNDPCPCGSGKKYKHCCLNRPKDPLDAVESLNTRNKWLEEYPQIGGEKLPGRVYLEDYFDAESIMIDRILYLALKKRPMYWNKQEGEYMAALRRGKYLAIAFPMFVDKVKKENIQTFTEYDQKHSIHYYCAEWLEELVAYLQAIGDDALCDEVEQCIVAMS